MTDARRHAPDEDGPVPVVHEDDLRPVHDRSRAGPATARGVVVALVAVLVVTLVRPWDTGGATPAARPPAASPAGLAPTSTPAPDPTAWQADAAGSPACASPRSWRVATIESWFGRTARVWAAAEAVEAAPGDPRLAFAPVIAEQITGLGWCAPVDGDERPPLTARGRLWRDEGGTITPVWTVRLEPDGPHALGELWGPAGGGEWPVGRYVIELATPSGAWGRVLAIDLRTARVEPVASPNAEPATPNAEVAEPATLAPAASVAAPPVPGP